jgi:hypothetical protein
MFGTVLGGADEAEPRAVLTGLVIDEADRCLVFPVREAFSIQPDFLMLLSMTMGTTPFPPFPEPNHRVAVSRATMG